ncbi:MAG: hypothetical protein PHY47_11085 [Lachnospiraceae bacterium]|nr:hypothetical protein [Lachnospiraceae bacterium]
MKRLPIKPYKLLGKKLLQNIDENFNISGKPKKLQLMIAVAAIVVAVLFKLLQRLFY